MNTPPLAHKIIIPRPWIKPECTDVAATFQRERERLAALAAPVKNVRPIKRAK